MSQATCEGNLHVRCHMQDALHLLLNRAIAENSKHVKSDPKGFAYEPHILQDTTQAHVTKRISV